MAYAVLLVGTGAALIILFYAYLRVVPGYAVGAAGPASMDDGSAASTDPIQTGSTLLSSMVLAALALAVIGVGVWVGWLIAGRLLRPLAAINEAAVRVGQGDLGHRVQLTGPDDEFANLARTFDAMLDRIQGSLDAHQRFAANASHELHTPLSANKTMLDVALDDPASADFLELAKRLQRTNQHSIETVEALLDLADIGQSQLEKTTVDLRDLTETLLGGLQAEAAVRSITVRSRVYAAVTRGNSVLLSQLITNLFQNAVRHNLAGGWIEIVTVMDDAHASIEITNTGEVLPEGVVSTLTEPFVRARGRTVDADHAGNGLGLAIVRSIVLAHDGSLVIAPRDGGGLIVTVSLPARAGH